MKIYNTMTGKKEEFETIEQGKVKMYICGPTVYNFIHVGNARTAIVFDAIRRYLLYKGYDVNYVQNYTDIDDKIINRANAEGVSIDTISERFIEEAQTDMAKLGIMEPTSSPRVTRELPEIIEMIETLLKEGFAYEKNGSVYYNTEAFPEYGKLSRKKLDELNAGARIEVDEEKKNPADFMLWKPAKENEPSWPSPWGDGRPGWHIECSVMAKKYLGEIIDIHAGGEDLIFPHHENEIAQSEAANGKMFSKYWMHARHVNMNNQKMSKSKGNFSTAREAAEKYTYEVVRFFSLSNHYRSSVNFSSETMEAAVNSYNRVKNCVFNLKHSLKENLRECITENEAANISKAQRFPKDFENAMDDDFNTADAVSEIFEYVRFANSTVNEDSSKEYIEAMLNGIINLCDILGIQINDGKQQADDGEIEALIEQRQAARRAKDFKTADEIRDKLISMGITLEDTRQGVRYMRVDN